jgi:paraquat-inducible protein A
MLDIFAVSILTALVQLQSLAEVTAGPAVLAFGAVCVMTILASHSFDPRLIWDPFDASGVDPDREDD